MFVRIHGQSQNKMCTDILGSYYPHPLWKGLYSKLSFPQTSHFLFVHNYNDGVAPSVWQVPDNRSNMTLSISPSRDILLYILNNGVTPFLYKGSVHYRRKKSFLQFFFYKDRIQQDMYLFLYEQIIQSVWKMCRLYSLNTVQCLQNLLRDSGTKIMDFGLVILSSVSRTWTPCASPWARQQHKNLKMRVRLEFQKRRIYNFAPAPTSKH